MNTPNVNLLDEAKDRDLLIEKRKITRSLLISSVIITFVSFSYLFYFSEKYEQISQLQIKTNEQINLYSRIKKDGLTSSEIKDLATSGIIEGKFPTDIFNDMGLLSEALQKPADVMDSYNEWLIKQLAASSTLTTAAVNNEKIIGGILPIYGSGDRQSLDGKTSAPQMNIQKFVRHIEERYLKVFNLVSESSLSFGTFEMKKDDSQLFLYGENQLNLSVKGKLQDINNLIDTLQKSGQFSIKNNSFVAPQDPYDFANLLVSVAKVSFNFETEVPSPDLVTSAELSLIFYIRGLTFTQVSELLSSVKTQVESLSSRAKSVLARCAPGTSKIQACKSDENTQLISQLRVYSNDLTKLQQFLAKQVIKADTLDFTELERQLQAELSKIKNIDRVVGQAEQKLK